MPWMCFQLDGEFEDNARRNAAQAHEKFLCRIVGNVFFFFLYFFVALQLDVVSQLEVKSNEEGLDQKKPR